MHCSYTTRTERRGSLRYTQVMKQLLASAMLFLVTLASSPLTAYAETVPVALTECRVPAPGLAVGSRSADVALLQSFLATRYGVATSTLVTGYFGPLTRSYIVRLQQEEKLPQVGVFGPRTRAVMLAACPGGTRAVEPRTAPGSGMSALTCRVAATPSRILQNQEVKITWTSENAAYAVWDSGEREAATGTRSFSDIATTTRKTLTFYGRSTQVACGVQITVVTSSTTGGAGSAGSYARPAASVCPATQWTMPGTPCSGSWVPSYTTAGCQSGWQCIPTSTAPKTTGASVSCPSVAFTPALCGGALTSLRDQNGCQTGWQCTEPGTGKGASLCPLIEYIPGPCNGQLSIVRDSAGCQTGWRCDALGQNNVTKPKDACANVPQVLPACDAATAVRDANGCIVSWQCPSAPPLLKIDAPKCPAIGFAPILCTGTLIMIKDQNGCQTGWRCDDQ